MYLSNTNMSICVAGDLNLPRMDWVNNRSPNNDIYIEFSSYFKNNSLVQLVDFPTRGDNMLNVILTDNAQQIVNIHPLPPIGNSDHLTISWNLILDSDSVSNLSIEPPSVHSSRDYNFINYKYYKADWQSITNVLSSINWYNEFDVCETVDECWDRFCFAIKNSFDLYIPQKPTRYHPKPRNCKSKRNTKQ